MAAGDRHRHDHSHRLASRVNGAFIGGVILPGPAGRAADRVAVARSLERRGRRASGSRGARRTQNIVFLLIVARASLALTFVGMFLRGPVLALLLAVGSLARASRRGSDMETAHQLSVPAARPAGAGRHRRACSCSRTVLFMWSDRAHDWRYYQARVQAAWSPRSSAPTRRRRCRPGVQQIWVADLAPRRPLHDLPPGHRSGRASRRPSTRSAPIPTSRCAAHPLEKLRLHVLPRRSGLGHGHRAPRTARCAHWEEPLLSRSLGESYSLVDNKTALMQMNCNVCHRYDRETQGRRRSSTSAKRLVQREGLPRLPRDQRPRRHDRPRPHATSATRRPSSTTSAACRARRRRSPGTSRTSRTRARSCRTP